MRTVSESNAAPPADPRRPGYWADLVFGRALPALFFGLFIIVYGYGTIQTGAALGRSGVSVDDVLAFANRALRLAFFTMLVVMYVIRLPTKKADRRPLVVLISFVGTFCIVATSFLPANNHGPVAIAISDFLITIGMAWSVWGLAYLRRSFSIIPEARRLVTGGPFGLSRNPLYFGEGIASIGVVLPVFSIWHALLLAIFVASQLLRIRWEQRVLEEAFGDQFRDYLRRVPMLVPFWPVRG
jgi:protein-S-isoprenylcysteine O-methyltransferase Ste14